MKKNFWNLISTIKNAQLVNKLIVKYKREKKCEMLLNILWDEGYILGYKSSDKFLKIYLKYNSNKSPVITNFQVISKPSSKTYFSLKQLWKVNDNQGLLILSTNQGLCSINSCKKLGIGGEPLLIIK